MAFLDGESSALLLNPAPELAEDLGDLVEFAGTLVDLVEDVLKFPEVLKQGHVKLEDPVLRFRDLHPIYLALFLAEVEIQL